MHKKTKLLQKNKSNFLQFNMHNPVQFQRLMQLLIL